MAVTTAGRYGGPFRNAAAIATDGLLQWGRFLQHAPIPAPSAGKGRSTATRAPSPAICSPCSGQTSRTPRRSEPRIRRITSTRIRTSTSCATCSSCRHRSIKSSRVTKMPP